MPESKAVLVATKFDHSSPPPTQEVFVPIHGAVYLYPEEMAIIDHPAFQRLTRMRQLGLAHRVFPGANHTRFEHSLGALHVAQKIIDSVNVNYAKRRHEDSDRTVWRIQSIDEVTARFIRLAALLHDLGHLPLGHTLEDELGHLPRHDDAARLLEIGDRSYPHYSLRRSKYFADDVRNDLAERGSAWTFKRTLNALYSPLAQRLGSGLSAFEIFLAIICKPPKVEAVEPHGKASETERAKPDDKASSDEIGLQLGTCMSISVCRDIVGNTICADLLDYLVRDWFHIGKPFHLDERIYQLMEVRNKVNDAPGDAKFVINAGGQDKIYLDAFTNVLDLLESRYKLTETVIFHRTKVSLNAILDRCLLEIRDIWSRAKLPDDAFPKQAVDDLLGGSDDGVPDLLKHWLEGGGDKSRLAISALKTEERRALGEEGQQHKLSILETSADEYDDQFATAEKLVERLRDRQNYKLVYKLQRSKFAMNDGHHEKFMSLYKVGKNRHAYLRGVESLCWLPEGSLISYFPPDRAMNAKVAHVHLLLNGVVERFSDYEEDRQKRKEESLTSGTLMAQVERFKHLWSFQVFMERSQHERLTAAQRAALIEVLTRCLFDMDGEPASRALQRRELEIYLNVVRGQTRRAARSGSATPLKMPRGFEFPSGMLYDAGKE